MTHWNNRTLNAGDIAWELDSLFPKIVTVIGRTDNSGASLYTVRARDGREHLAHSFEMFAYPSHRDEVLREMRHRAKMQRSEADELESVEPDHLDYYVGLADTCQCAECRERVELRNEVAHDAC